MKVETFTSPNVMKPIGPNSHVAKAGQFIWISGTAGVDVKTGQLAGPDVYSQAQQILKSMRTLLTEAGSSMRHVTHVHVFLKSMQDFADMNRAYVEAFGDYLPARSVVGVSDLPKTWCTPDDESHRRRCGLIRRITPRHESMPQRS